MEARKNKRSQGQHCKKNEVKTEIIDYILSNGGEVSGPNIRRHLKEKYRIVDRKNIEDHLKKLNSGYHCVEKIEPDRDGCENKWAINKIKNLKNIKKEFSSIQLSDYTKTKDILIKENFPDIQLRLYKKYFIYISLFPSSFDTFLDNEFEPMLIRALELWEINDYKDTINSLTDFVYDRSFLLDDWLNPPAKKQIIEISKDEFKKILSEIQYPYEEQDVEKKLLEELTKVVLSKRPNSTKDQVQKEVSEKIINRLYWTSQDRIFEIVFYQHLRMYKIYDKLCKHLYENDFLIGKGSQDAKTFVEKLEKCISLVNSEEMLNGINDLDALYDEWYDKCLKIEKDRLIRRNMQPEN